MIFGYARVSTTDQNPNLQIDALNAAGCEKLFTEKMTGTTADRPELNRLKEFLRKGDTVVIWKLDRLGRSVKDLIEWITYFEHEGVTLRCLKENIDTSTPTGRLIFHIFASLAEFERDLIVERTIAGLAAARKRGIKGGRRPKLDSKKVKLLVEMYEQQKPLKEIQELFGVGETTLYNYVKKYRAQNPKNPSRANSN